MVLEKPSEDETGFHIYFRTAFPIFKFILVSCNREVGGRHECRTYRGIPDVQTVAMGALTAADIFFSFTSTKVFCTDDGKLPPANAIVQSMEHM